MSKENIKIHVYTRFHLPPSTPVKFVDASLTRQEFVQEADLNNIMRKYAAGLAPVPSGDRPPLFGDFSDIGDYQSNMQRMIEARESFMSLPSDLRLRFRNDPGELLAFLADESNRDEAIKLGLINNPKPEKSGEGEEQAKRSSPEAETAT